MKRHSRRIATSRAEYRECSRRLALQSKIESIQNEADKAYFVFKPKEFPTAKCYNDNRMSKFKSFDRKSKICEQISKKFGDYRCNDVVTKNVFVFCSAEDSAAKRLFRLFDILQSLWRALFYGYSYHKRTYISVSHNRVTT